MSAKLATLREPAADDRPRLLLVSYHFPPGRAAGAVRWEKLAAYATEIGWGLDVIAVLPEPDAVEAGEHRLKGLSAPVGLYAVAERSLFLDRLEHGVWSLFRRVARSGRAPGGRSSGDAPPAAAAEPDRPSAFGRLKRAWHAWREYARFGDWARRVARASRELTSEIAYAAVLTSGPPHLAHDAGRRIAERIGAPLVLDLRDPWSLVQRLPDDMDSPFWYRLARRHERRCVARADLVAMNTEPAAEAMAERHPELGSRLVVVRNGADYDTPAAATRTGVFTIGYAGTVYLDRDPTTLFRAVARLADQHDLSPSVLSVTFMGHVATYRGQTLDSVARAAGLDPDFVRLRPPGPRAEALEFLAGCQVVVSLPQDSSFAVPSKVYEYSELEARLLAFAEPDSATGRVLAPVNADTVRPGDVDATAAVLESAYRDHREGRTPGPVDPDRLLSRRVQARRLFERLAEVVVAGRDGQPARVPAPAPAPAPEAEETAAS